MPAHFLKAALLGLVGGFLSAAAVLTVEIIYSLRVVASQMGNCADSVCDGYAQAGGAVELSVAFALGFAAVFVWYLRRTQKANGPDSDRAVTP
jgi:hypothetical protein